MSHEIHKKFLLDGIDSLTTDETIHLINYLGEQVKVNKAAQDTVDAAIAFEGEITHSFAKYMQQGLSVTQAIGIFSLKISEIGVAFFSVREEGG